MDSKTSVFVTKIKTSIINNYDGFPLDSSLEHPDFAFNHLKPHPSNGSWFDDKEFSCEFIKTVSELECFTYRALNTVNGTDFYWNPLLESFSSFKKENTVIYQSDTLYPTPDMIFTWCMRQKS